MPKSEMGCFFSLLFSLLLMFNKYGDHVFSGIIVMCFFFVHGKDMSMAYDSEIKKTTKYRYFNSWPLCVIKCVIVIYTSQDTLQI